MRIQGQLGVSAAADRHRQPGPVAGGQLDVGRPIDEVDQLLQIGVGADGDHAHVLDHLAPGGRYRRVDDAQLRADRIRSGGAPAGMLNAMSACRCAPAPSVNGNRAGVAGQPSGHTTSTTPPSTESVQSLAAVRRSTTSSPGWPRTRRGCRWATAGSPPSGAGPRLCSQ